ncbi:MAG TPA: hypothetical protein VFO80_11775 [Sphingomonas sp.]|nr:hypothetical protein [Sphingomonas sp.]
MLDFHLDRRRSNTREAICIHRRIQWRRLLKAADSGQATLARTRKGGGKASSRTGARKMTKPRTPHSWAAAVTRIAGHIGWDGSARAVGKTEALVRAWSDDATGKRPSLDQARDLSVAYAQAGGEGEPFLDAFAFQIGATVADRDPCRRALTAEIADCAQEFGDVIATALALTNHAATPLVALRAFAEAEQADERLAALMRRIASFLPPSGTAAAGKSGGSLT